MAGKEWIEMKCKQGKGSLLVSACLLGEKCRYNGGDCASPQFLASLEGQRVIPFCPEVLGGLPTPRAPAEIRGGGGEQVWAGQAVVVGKDGRDLTTQYKSGAERTLALARKHRVQWGIAKEKSPACGCHKIYDGMFRGKLIPGAGVAVSLLKKNKIKIISESDWLRRRGEGFFEKTSLV